MNLSAYLGVSLQALPRGNREGRLARLREVDALAHVVTDWAEVEPVPSDLRMAVVVKPLGKDAGQNFSQWPRDTPGDVQLDMLAVELDDTEPYSAFVYLVIATVGDQPPFVVLLRLPDDADLMQRLNRTPTFQLLLRDGEKLQPAPYAIVLQEEDLKPLRRACIFDEQRNGKLRSEPLAAAVQERAYVLQHLRECMQTSLDHADAKVRGVANVIQTGYQLALQAGNLYYCSPDPAKLITVAGEQLPGDTVLTPELVPTSGGYWYNARPMLLHYPSEATRLCWSFFWAVVPRQEDLPTRGLIPPDKGSGVAFGFTAWPRGNDGVRRHELAFSLIVPFGMSLDELGAQLKDDLGQSELDVARTRCRLSMVLAALLFVRQRVLVTSAGQMPRADVRRLAKANVDQEHLRVVTLRAAEDTGRSAGRGDESIEWSHRWIVSGHWHRYWVGTGTKRVLEPQWLMPYVKGPDDKPLDLSGADPIYAVKR